MLSSTLVRLALLVALATSAAGPPQLVASASCERAAGPGRVRCEVVVHTENGALRWSDVVVTAAPKFAPPLRTRVAPVDATKGEDGSLRFPLALAAVGAGTGKLEVRARGVVCGARGCAPVTAEAAAEVVVGDAAVNRRARDTPP